MEKEAIAAGTAKAAGASLMIRASGSKKDEKTDIIKQEDANPSKPESKKRTKTRYETSSDEEDYSSEEDEEIDDEVSVPP